MSEQKWVRHSLVAIARQLARRRFRIGPHTVRRLLKKLKYGLYGNRKSLTGPSHPDRDKQFRYIRRIKKLFLAAGYPVISVDTKKKELIGTSLTRDAVGLNSQSKFTYTIFLKMLSVVLCLMVSMT